MFPAISLYAYNCHAKMFVYEYFLRIQNHINITFFFTERDFYADKIFTSV